MSGLCNRRLRVGDRIRLRDVLTLIDALVSVGLEDVRFEGLASVPRKGPRKAP